MTASSVVSLDSIVLIVCMSLLFSVVSARNACSLFVAVDDGYQSLSSTCLRKRAAVRQLKLQLQQLEIQRTNSHQCIDAHVQQLVVSSLFLLSYSVSK